MTDSPRFSIVLCTIRPTYGAYREDPDRHVLLSVIDDLAAQTCRDFELLIVDGRYVERRRILRDSESLPGAFPIYHMPPWSPWAPEGQAPIAPHISGARNTALVYARGEVVLNLDDCCRLPPDYVEYARAFWVGYNWNMVAATASDPRPEGLVGDVGGWPSPQVYGFNSFPLEAALVVNGYDEAFDGGQGLEDVDFSTRLHRYGVRHVVYRVPGFTIEAQSPHVSPLEVPLDVHRCCNRAWQLQRVQRSSQVVNQTLMARDLDYLRVPPCPLLLPDGMCQHHGGRVACAYPDLAHGTAAASERVRRSMNTPVPAFDLGTRRAMSQDLDPARKWRIR